MEQLPPWIAPNAQEELRKLMRQLDADEISQQEPLGMQTRQIDEMEVLNLFGSPDHSRTRLIQLRHCEDLTNKGTFVEEDKNTYDHRFYRTCITTYRGSETFSLMLYLKWDRLTTSANALLTYCVWNEEEKMKVEYPFPLDLVLCVDKSVKYITNMGRVFKIPFGIDMKPAERPSSE
jgi:hypothetical protein